MAALRMVWMSDSETASEVYWRTLFLLWMFSRTASALLPELQHEFMVNKVKAETAMILMMFFIMSKCYNNPHRSESISPVSFPTDGDKCIQKRLISVKRHAVGLHAYLLAHGSKNLLVCLASFLCLSCDEVKVGCCVCEHLVNQVHYELHILLHEAS